MKNKQQFIDSIRSSFKFNIFLITNLPMAFLSGLRVLFFDENNAVVSVPYRWLTQNPFQSTYFACLAMAAEMSTGLLVMSNVLGHSKPVSMLVVDLNCQFSKKCKERIFFECIDGLLIQSAAQKAIDTNESQAIKTQSIGRNIAGEEVCRFEVTWSLKVKLTA
jgi:hypothetical protein